VRTSGVLAPISDVSTYFRTAQPGDAVTLFEQDGKVRYFEVRRGAAPVVAPDAAAEPTARRRPSGRTEELALEARLAALEDEIAALRKARPAKTARPPTTARPAKTAGSAKTAGAATTTGAKTAAKTGAKAARAPRKAQPTRKQATPPET
jgi:hypothetical protein